MDHDTNDDHDATTADDPAATGPTTEAVRTTWNGTDQPSEALVDAVATATDRSPTDLPPLHRTLDVDALETMLTGSDGTTVSVWFRYADTDVRMTADGTLEVRPTGTPPAGED